MPRFRWCRVAGIGFVTRWERGGASQLALRKGKGNKPPTTSKDNVRPVPRSVAKVHHCEVKPFPKTHPTK